MCEEKIFSNESFIVSNSKYEPKIQSFKEKFKIKRNFIKANFLFSSPVKKKIILFLSISKLYEGRKNQTFTDHDSN